MEEKQYNKVELNGMKIHELQYILRERQLLYSGKKEELIHRIMLSQTTSDPLSLLDHMIKQQLVQQCLDNNLSSSGTKQALIERLRENSEKSKSFNKENITLYNSNASTSNMEVGKSVVSNNQESSNVTLTKMTPGFKDHGDYNNYEQTSIVSCSENAKNWESGSYTNISSNLERKRSLETYEIEHQVTVVPINPTVSTAHISKTIDSNLERIPKIRDKDSTNSNEIEALEHAERSVNSMELTELSEDSGDDNLIAVGGFKTKVVGIQHYSGVVSKHEKVLLKREPRNPYDRNAIKVCNQYGDQVGHISRNVASSLAPLMDTGILQMDGISLDHSYKKKYTLNAILSGYCLSDKKDFVLSKFPNFSLDIYNKTYAKLNKQSWDTSERKIAQSQYQEWIDKAKQLTPIKSQELLDGVLAHATKTLESLPYAPKPANLLTELLPYQQQGLGWMLSSENPQLPSDDQTLVQLWKKSANLYTNIATNFSTSSRPTLIRGGLLADSMGLGKTIQIISLILYDYQPNNGFISKPIPSTPQFMNVKTTLIVTPLSVMGVWQEQLKKHVNQDCVSLSVYLYYGSNRKLEDLAKYDVILTTYSVIASEYKKENSHDSKRRKSDGSFFKLPFRRIVLDEGHLIRNPKTLQHKGVCFIQAERRWVLSGTPIQNDLKDLYAIAKFLKYYPFGTYDIYRNCITLPIKNHQAEGISTLRALIQSFSIRRTRDMKFNGKRILNLPSCSVYLHSIPFATTEEQELYNEIQTEMVNLVNHLQKKQDHTSSKTNLTSSLIIEICLRLRQFCDHPSLLRKYLKKREKLKKEFQKNTSEMGSSLNPEELAKLLKELYQLNESEECCICLTVLDHPVMTNCSHFFCKSCITEVLKRQQTCPLCRNPIDKSKLIDTETAEQLKSLHTSYDENTDDEDTPMMQKNFCSTKIKALIHMLETIRKTGAVGNVKSVVFSQWTSMLDIIEPFLIEKGFKLVRLDGKMSHDARNKAVETFQTDSNVHLILVSLKCGSLGVTLTAASHVYMIDPWYNPSVESQSIDRVVRIGQTKEVSVFRFLIENSIEERVLQLQIQKKALHADAFSEKTPIEETMRSKYLELLIGDSLSSIELTSSSILSTESKDSTS